LNKNHIAIAGYSVNNNFGSNENFYNSPLGAEENLNN
jgi:hypothetical protein